MPVKMNDCFVYHVFIMAGFLTVMMFLLFLPIIVGSPYQLDSMELQQVPTNPPERIIMSSENLLLAPDPSRSHSIIVRITDANGLPPSPLSASVTVRLNATAGTFINSDNTTLNVTIGVNDGWRTAVFYRPPTVEGMVTITASATNLIGDNLTFYIISSPSGDFALELKTNASVAEVSSEVKSIEILAVLRDSNDSQTVIDVSDVPITFLVNGSQFLESSESIITLTLTNGQAQVHLLVPTSPMKVNVTAYVDVNIKTSVYVMFTASESASTQNDKEQPLAAEFNDLAEPIGSMLDDAVTFITSNPLLGASLVVIAVTTIIFGAARVINIPFVGFRREKDDDALGFFERVELSLISIIAAISTSRWYRRIELEDVLENEYRRKIVEYLQRQRISHLRALQKYLKCGTSILMWHLEVLEEYGYVEKMKHGQYILYYLTHYRPSSDELKVYMALINANARKIIHVLMRHPYLTVNQIEQLTELHRKTIKYQLKRLKKLGIIQKNVLDQVNKNSYMINVRFLALLKKFMESAS